MKSFFKAVICFFCCIATLISCEKEIPQRQFQLNVNGVDLTLWVSQIDQGKGSYADYAKNKKTGIRDFYISIVCLDAGVVSLDYIYGFDYSPSHEPRKGDVFTKENNNVYQYNSGAIEVKKVNENTITLDFNHYSFVDEDKNKVVLDGIVTLPYIVVHDEPEQPDPDLPNPDEKPDPIKNEEFTVNGVSFKMIAVEGGTFTMGATPEQGDDAYSDEKPAHQVTLSDYYIGQFEVTQELWEAVMGSNPSKFKAPKNPVECVSWDNIVNGFLPKLNALTGKTFTLPTEAQWEYAARGGNKSQGHKYSGSNNLGEVAWHYHNSEDTSHPVGQKLPNELGLYDMSGNVGEWCSDWYGDYSAEAQTDPTGPSSGSRRVMRGGFFRTDHGYIVDCRVSSRFSSNPGRGDDCIGFRLVLTGSGKDDIEQEPRLSGNLGFYVDKYISPEMQLTFKAEDAKHPENKGIGYAWKVTPGMEKADTVKTEEQTDRSNTFTYRFGKDLKTYSITVQAFASGYKSISNTRKVTVVKGGIDGSISGSGIAEEDPFFIDSRDNRIYHYQTIGKLNWMRENLAYKGSGIPYCDYEVMNDVLGRYYSWTDAQTVCPEGWRLPSEQDIENLAAGLGVKTTGEKFAPIPEIAGALMANVLFNGKTMWNSLPENKITNKSKLAFLPCGFVNFQSGRWDGVLDYATFWTSESDHEFGVCRYIKNVDKGDSNLLSSKMDKLSIGANVRCVRNR